MADKIVLVDTSILIDHFRKTNKSQSILISLVKQDYIYCISVITDYEIYTGTTPEQLNFWNSFLQKTEVLPFDKKVANVAVDINKQLKKKRKQIAIPDLFIAATAVANGLPLATLNKKHFQRIDELTLVA
ncbi:type II toxin-antitoxin system VapC family toxin [Compostibacter hankyongensis]|uniref:Ribonuclease VapC n=1 Tax=Compostibacter hankyongensis TaxID=1007089 RepID=A0ABP8FV69_9BACT